MAVKNLDPATEIKTVPRYPNTPLGALALQFTFYAADVASDGIQFPVTGREVILLQNTTGGALTFTITSVACSHGRSADITAYSVGANGFSYVPLGAKELFGTAGGLLKIVVSAVGLKVAVLLLEKNV